MTPRRLEPNSRILIIKPDGEEIVATFLRERPPSLIMIRLENGMIQNLREEEIDQLYRL